MYIDVSEIFPGIFIKILCETSLYYILMRSFVKDKINSLLNLLMLFLIPFSALSAITLMRGYPEGFGLIITIGLCTVISFLTFREKVGQLVLYNIFTYILELLLYIFSMMFYTLMFPEFAEYDIAHSSSSVWSIPSIVFSFFVPLLISFPISGLIRKFYNKEINKISWKSFGYLMMPLSHIAPIILISILSLNIPDEYFATNLPIEKILFFTILISFIADFYIFYMVDKTEDAYKKNIYLMLQNNKNAVEYNYVKQLKSDNDSLRRMRHDIINLNSSVALLIKNEKYDKALETIENIDNSIRNIIPVPFCGNNILNALLSIEKKKAEEAGVEIKIDVKCGERLTIDNADLSSLFFNLIDNAIEAAANSDGKNEVHIYCKPLNNSLAIDVKNSFSEGDKRKPFFATGKLDKSNHGIGTKIIKEIVKKYSGTIDYRIKDGVVSSFVVIPDMMC